MSAAKAKAKASSAKASSAKASAPSAGRASGSDRPCLVVGYDHTASSRHAVDWAAQRLAGAGKLVLVYACRPLHAPLSPLETAEERRAFAGAAIDELLLEAGDALLDADVVTEISTEDPVSALTDAARRHGAEAIVVGCEQHSRLHKAIGTVTSELLASSPVAVTAVPSAASVD